MSGAVPHFSTFAQRLEWARVYRGFKTGKALADAVDLSARQLYRLQDKNTTSMATMARLAEVLQVNQAWLAYGHGVPFPLPSVVKYLRSERGKKLAPEVARYLREWPLDFFGTLTPNDEEIREAIVLIDYLLHRARQRGDGDKGEK